MAEEGAVVVEGGEGVEEVDLLPSMKMVVGIGTGALIGVGVEEGDLVPVVVAEEEIMDLVVTCSKMEDTVMMHLLNPVAVAVEEAIVEGPVDLDHQMG